MAVVSNYLFKNHVRPRFTKNLLLLRLNEISENQMAYIKNLEVLRR
jgi:hypothetical protein